jgi:lysophospholipase L1-like esterase
MDSVPQKVAFIGASSVHGKVDPAGGFVSHVKAYLEDINGEHNHVYNLGVPGEISSEMLARMKDELKVRDIDLVFVMFSSNDSVRLIETDELVVSDEQYLANVHTVSTVCEELGAQLVFIAPFPVDESKTCPFSDSGKNFTNKRLGKLVALLREYCEVHQHHLIDLYRLFESRPADEFLHSDGLHCGEAGHREIANAIIDWLQAEHQTLEVVTNA